MLNLLNEKATRSIARKHDIPEDFFCGVVQQESAGRFFWTVGGKKMPSIRPEGHYFWRILKKEDKVGFKKAVAEGLAKPRAGQLHVPANPSEVYAIFDRMWAINTEAAIRSISMGVGQIMGDNYKHLGYPSARAMWDFCVAAPINQLEIMARFIDANPTLHLAAKKYDYVAFARGYNGPGYRKNNYDTSLKKNVMLFKEVAAPKTKTIATFAAVGGSGVGIGGTIIGSSQDAQDFVWGISPITDSIAMISDNAATIVGAATALVVLGFIAFGVYKWMTRKD